MPDLGVLRNEDPRDTWRDEARDFTPWLAEHISTLGEVLGIEIELVQVEKDVGDFSIDILARDLGRDRLVVIENQLQVTDHSHLGQILTYAAGVEAGSVAWVSREFRAEHRKAIDWLNRGFAGQVNFFGVVLEVLRIDNSRPAVNLRLVAAPNEWGRGPSPRGPGELSERQEAYIRFFQGLIDELREKHRFTNARVAQPMSWYSFGSGYSGLHFNVAFKSGRRMCTELYIDVGDGDHNERILINLQAHRERVERELGESLSWEELATKRACRVAAYREASIQDAQADLDEYHAWAVERLLAFKRVFGPLLGPAAAAAEGG